jgi:glycosyltransferase involved in cell wall biosynthesis
MKVAIIHDWLTGMRGGEKCLEVFCELFPQATIFTLLHNKGSASEIIERMRIKTSFIQNLPYASTKYRNYLPFFPQAIESFNLEGFDFILSSSHCVAKGAKKPKNAFHLCYCYTPMRYAWLFFDEYFGNCWIGKKKFIKMVCENLKRWDIATLPRVDEFAAISETVKQRIKDIYQKDARIIYPPVDVDRFYLDKGAKKEDYYLCVSALVPYKRIDIIIEAFNQMPDKKLVVVGEGNIKEDLKDKKVSSNISFLGWLNERELTRIYQAAKVFVYAAEEDFGISVVEAQACGLPVIAFAKGGICETVVPLQEKTHRLDATGIFFKEQSSAHLMAAIEEFEKQEKEFNPQQIRNNALRFSRGRFKDNIKNLIIEKTGSI